MSFFISLVPSSKGLKVDYYLWIKF